MSQFRVDGRKLGEQFLPLGVSHITANKSIFAACKIFLSDNNQYHEIIVVDVISEQVLFSTKQGIN